MLPHSLLRTGCTILIGITLAVSCNGPSFLAGAGIATLVAGQTPTQSLEQTYYVGVFDPLEQIPPAVYRLTVRGQASSLSAMRFASGWVPAALVDGLGSRLAFGDEGQIRVERDTDSTAAIHPSRRMMMFGPEGFREAPRDHRLAIVMSSNPEKFFEALQISLAAVVSVQQQEFQSADSQAILEELYRLNREQDDLDELAARFASASKEGK